MCDWFYALLYGILSIQFSVSGKPVDRRMTNNKRILNYGHNVKQSWTLASKERLVNHGQKASLTSLEDDNLHREKRAVGAHGVNLEVWFNMEGYSIDSLEKNFRFPKTPDLKTLSHTFTEPSNIGESFGSRMYAWFSPPSTGHFVFFIASNQDGRLYISTDDDPKNKRLVCEITNLDYTSKGNWFKYDSQRSPPIPMIKGNYYYMEAVHKELFGEDDLEVAVRTQSGTFIGPIEERYLYYYYKSSNKGGKADDPLDAGVAAGIKAGENVLKKAQKKAAEAAREAAEEAVKETMGVMELPTGDGKGKAAKYIEDVNITAAAEGLMLGLKPSLIQGWVATRHQGPIHLYSMDFPAPQEEHRKNLAITVENNQLILGQYGSCWVPHTPGNMPEGSHYNESQTVSLELMNSDGYFMMQKNYGFVVAKKEQQSNRFGFETAFTERHRVSAPRTSFFTLTAAGHWGWAMCVGEKIGHLKYKIKFLFDDESKKYIRNCSFYVEPSDNCTQSKYTPVKERPKPINKTITQLETCLTLSFINKVNTAILIQSSVKPSPYKITEKNFDLKMKFRPPNYAPVTFNTSDPEFTQRKCFLNGRILLETSPSKNCNDTIHVVITCEYKAIPTTIAPPKKKKKNQTKKEKKIKTKASNQKTEHNMPRSSRTSRTTRETRDNGTSGNTRTTWDSWDFGTTRSSWSKRFIRKF